MMASLDLNPQLIQTKHDQSSRVSLILLHGGALSHRMFKSVVPHLASKCSQIYAPDLPGHGDSVHLGPFTFSNSTSLLLSAIKQLRSKEDTEICLVGVSLGGQAVLNVLQHDEDHLVDCAIVASAPVRPPDTAAQWEMPVMPPDQAWLDMMMEDVKKMGMENASQLQNESFNFNLEVPQTLPPVLVVIGSGDIAMAKRDYEYLCDEVKKANEKSKGLVLEDAWHNHPIDIPERFAQVILDWIQEALE